MFEDSLFASAGKRNTNGPVTIAVSFLLQTVAVGIMLLIPLVYTEALPRRLMTSILVTPPPPRAPRPVDSPPAVHVAPRLAQQQRAFVQPIAIPKHPAMLREEPLPPVVSGVVSNQAALGEYAPIGLLSEAITVEPLPPIVPDRIKVGGQVAAAKLIFQPRPVYPELPRRVHVQGTVRLQALISKDGSIENLTVLSGHPLLIPAALDAVQKWRYQPTLLNDVPVEVETTIDVNFKLSG